jgi:hypothetical protein
MYALDAKAVVCASEVDVGRASQVKSMDPGCALRVTHVRDIYRRPSTVIDPRQSGTCPGRSGPLLRPAMVSISVPSLTFNVQRVLVRGRSEHSIQALRLITSARGPVTRACAIRQFGTALATSSAHRRDVASCPSDTRRAGKIVSRSLSLSLSHRAFSTSPVRTKEMATITLKRTGQKVRLSRYRKR